MGKKLLLTFGMLAMLMGLVAGPVAAAGSTGQGDGTGDTIEPLLTRSHHAQIRTTTLGEANVQNFSLSGNGSSLTASITVKDNLPTAGNVALQAPYGGVHVMALFDTPELEDHNEVIGKTATGCDVKWGSALPGLPGSVGHTAIGPCKPTGLPSSNNAYRAADGFKWFLYWGITSSECADAAVNADCMEYGLGIYEPDPVGELYVILGQSHITSLCGNMLGNGRGNDATASVSGNTVNITIPYTYRYLVRTRDLTGGNPVSSCLVRTKEVAKAGQGVNNAVGFSWMDHEIGGPDPVGLLFGLTWYTDALPSTARFWGTLAGDGNPAAVPGPFCATNLVGLTSQACYIDGPGPQFFNTGLGFIG